MGESFQILSQNMGFVGDAYGMNSLMGVIVFVAFIDLAFKGWAMWRAARMNKHYWYVALLIVNSAGIFPAIFLLMTNKEYNKHLRS
ncbi:MAG: DUF5652 family protein [bacterium]|nr:DUF5652 family protein [bacterium]